MKLDSFNWLNKSEFNVEGDKITIAAPPLSDYFNNPVPEDGVFKAPQGNAPFFYTDVEGDFVCRVKVKPNFQTDYDAACIMIMQDDNLWVKAAFEKSDFDTTAVVSVVTNKLSDDANGCNVSAEAVWLQVARVGNNFAIHYSLDGKNFDMVRLCFLPVDSTIKVGIESQCPTGQGVSHEFYNLSIEKRSISDLRAGV